MIIQPCPVSLTWLFFLYMQCAVYFIRFPRPATASTFCGCAYSMQPRLIRRLHPSIRDALRYYLVASCSATDYHMRHA